MTIALFPLFKVSYRMCPYADLLLDVLDDPQLNTVLPQGMALLSGISFKRIDEVCAAARKADFQITAQQEQAWWHSLILQR